MKAAVVSIIATVAPTVCAAIIAVMRESIG